MNPLFPGAGCGAFPIVGYNHTGDSLAGSVVRIAADNGNDVPGGLCNGLYVGTGGDVCLQDAHGNSPVFKNVANGATLNVRVRRVLATGTTAGDLVALY